MVYKCSYELVDECLAITCRLGQRLFESDAILYFC